MKNVWERPLAALLLLRNYPKNTPSFVHEEACKSRCNEDTLAKTLSQGGFWSNRMSA